MKRKLKKGELILFKNFEFKAEDAKESEDKTTGYVIGLSAAKNNLDSYRDRIKDGAFKKTIKDDPHWPVLRNHESWNKIGFNEKAKEIKEGLHTVSAIALDTPEGKAQYGLSKLALKIGGKDAQSIGYIARKWEMVNEEGVGEVRELLEVEMWEHSFVTWGANDQAFSSAVKSWKAGDKSFGLDKYVDDFFKFMEGLGHDEKTVKEILLNRKAQNQNATEALKTMTDTLTKALEIFKTA